MLKKAVHHVNRTVLRCLELTGVLAVLFFIAWGALLLRLSYGPLEINPYLTQKLETALDDQVEEFNFHVDRAQLIWGGQFEPLEVLLSNVNITRADNTPVFSVVKLGVQLSKRNLVFGRIVPRLIKVYGPTLRVIRQEDGVFTLNIGEEDLPPAVYGPPAPAPAHTGDTDRAQLVHDVLKQLQVHRGLGLLDGLSEIDIRDAAVVYEDKVLDVVWKSSGASVSVARGPQGIVSTAVLSLDMGENAQAAVHADIEYGWESRRTQATLAFINVNPAAIAQKSEQLKMLAGVDLPLAGSLRVALDENFRPGKMRAVLGAEPGSFSFPGLYDKPLAVKDFYASADFDARDGTGRIGQLRLDLGGPSVDATATIAPEGTAKLVTVKGELRDMPMDSLPEYWPESLTPDPRKWVTEHLSKGIATRATLDLKMAIDPAAENPVTVRDVGGKISYKGIKVDYLPPLQAVTEAKGTARYDKTSFNLDITGGKLKDMNVTKSVIHITDLHHAHSPDKHSHIDISVDLNGPLQTALRVLDSKPLQYPEKLGIKTKDVGGKADVNVSFKFPLHKHLTMPEVHVKAKAKLDDVMLKDMVEGMTLTGGPMDLDVDNDALKVKGKGRLGGMPVTFDWQKNFAKTQKEQSRLTASLPLDPAALKTFGMPDGYGLSGALPADVTYALNADKTARLTLKGDLTPLGFSVPALGFAKDPGEKGALSFTLALDKGHARRMSGISLNAAGLRLVGALDFAQDAGGQTQMQKAILSQFVLGDTNVALTAENKGAAGWSLSAKGAQIDASAAISPKGAAAQNSDAAAAQRVTPLHAFIDVGKLVTGPGRALTDVKASLDRNAWQRLDKLDVDAKAGGQLFSLRYDPAGAGHSLNLQANDAGAALSALGITNSIRGGKLSVDGAPQKTGPRDLMGNAILTDFTLKDAPVVAQLLNAMSLSGLMSLLGGEGMNFKKARVTYFWTDRGQPAQKENVRMLRLKDGQTSGASLGLSFEGNIDQWKNVFDLSGTIVPVSTLNKVLNIIPIVGQVLTAGGEGVIAATYTVKGPKDHATVTVNPLAALAPGILRKIFFEKN